MAFNAGSIEATLTLNRNPFTEGLKLARAQAKRFTSQKYEATLGVKINKGGMEVLERQLTAFARKVYTVRLRVSVQKGELNTLRAELTALTRRRHDVRIGFDVNKTQLAAARREVDKFLAQSRTALARVTVDRVQFDKLVHDLREFGRQTYTARARVNVDRSSLNGLLRDLNDLDGTINNARRSFNNFGNDGNRAFSRVNGGARALIMALPLILSVGGSAVTGLIGLLGALTSALGTAALGVGAFALVGTSVFKSISDNAKAASGLSEGAVAALNRVGDAQRTLDRAVEAGALARERASQAIEAAERSLTAAQRTAERAQEDLNQARRDAVEELEDLKLSLRGAALSEEQAMLDLEQAQLRYNEALKDGTSGVELKQLELNIRQAALAIDTTKEHYGDLKQESDEWSRTGIEGSRGVRDAQGRLVDATDSVRDAEREVKEARAEAARVGRDSARDVADAQRGLREANAAYAKEIAGTGAVITAAMQKASDALNRVKAEYNALVQRTQDPVANAFTASFDAAVAFLKTIDPLVVKTAVAFERIGRQIEEYFGGSHWAEFVQFLEANIVPNLMSIWDIIKFSTRAVFELVRAFDPLADWLLQNIADGMREFAEWAAKLSENPRFQEFIKEAAISLEKMWKFLVSVVKFLFELSVALTPAGNAIFDFFTMTFNALSKLPPEWLAAIALGISGIFAALLLGASGPIALVAGTIIGIAGALAYLYDKNENVKRSVTGFVDYVKQYFGPSFEKLGQQFEGVWPKLEKIGDTITGRVAPAFQTFMTAIKPFVTFMVEQVGGVAIDAILKLLDIFQYALDEIALAFEFWAAVFSGDWEKAWEKIKESFRIKVELIGTLFGDMWDDLITTLNEEKEIFINDWNGFVDKLWAKWDWFHGEMTAGWTNVLNWIEDELGIKRGTIVASWNKFWDDVWDKAWKVWEDLKLWWGNFWRDTFGTQETEQDKSKISWDSHWDNKHGKATLIFAAIQLAWSQFWSFFGVTQETGETDTDISWIQWMANLLIGFTKWKDGLLADWNAFWGGFNGTLDSWISTITTNWQNFWDNVGLTAKIAWAALTQSTQEAVDRLFAAWKRVGNTFRDPINWVIRVVLNDGIMGAWNTVMGWIGQPGLGVKRIPDIPAFAEGGKIQGPGNGTSDSILARVSNDEYIMPAAITRRHEHFLNALRSGQPEAIRAAGGSGANPYPTFATGGRVGAGIDFARSQVGKPYQWGGVGPGGYDCSGIISAVANVLMNRAPHQRLGSTDSAPWGGWSSGLTSQFGVGYFKGNPGHMAGTLAGTNIESAGGVGVRVGNARGARDGMFSGHMSLPQVGGEFIGGGSGAPVSFWSLFGSAATALFNGLLNFSGMPGLGSPVGDATTRVPKAMIPKVLESLKTKMSSLFTSSAIAGSASPNAGSMDVQNQVDAVAKQFGWGIGSDQWTPLSLIIGRESSWNPSAANPNSSARGLFQKMTSIHGPVESTVGGQTQWGLNYIKGRYGTPSAAWQHHVQKGWYDGGGWLKPGATAAFNGTGKPEAVLTSEQWSALTAPTPLPIGTTPTTEHSKTDMALDKLGTTMQDVRDLLERRGAAATINVNGAGGNATETARATVLALRLS